MELSKEDLEKIIKGVAEVIGVKKESKNMEEQEIVKALSGQARVFENFERAKNTFFKNQISNFKNLYPQRVHTFLNFSCNEDCLELSILDNRYVINYEVDSKEYNEKVSDNDYDTSKLGDFDKITGFFDKYIPMKMKCYFEHSDNKNKFYSIKEIIENFYNNR